MSLKVKDIAIFATKCSNLSKKSDVSAMSVLHMNQSQFFEINAGKICDQPGEKNGNLKIEFEWGPAMLGYAEVIQMSV